VHTRALIIQKNESHKRRTNDMGTNVLTMGEARQAVAEIDRRKMELEASLDSDKQALEKAEASLGDAVLDGDVDGIQQVTDLRLLVDGWRAGLAALERRRVAAEREVRRTEAADLRWWADVKRNNLATLEKETGKLLESLSQLEGVVYQAGILSLQWAGLWYAPPGLQTPQPWHAAFLDSAPDPTNRERFLEPRSRRLRREIEELEAKASAIEEELLRAPAPVSPVQPVRDYETETVSVSPAAPGVEGSYRNGGDE
jgi:hypothetical protein